LDGDTAFTSYTKNPTCLNTRKKRTRRNLDDVRTSQSERFIPFRIVLAELKKDPRYQESLLIARYFLQNAVLTTKEDEIFYRLLRLRITKKRLIFPRMPA